MNAPSTEGIEQPTQTIERPWWGGSDRPVTIASVFPQECTSHKNWGPRGGFSNFVLPAAERDGVSTLVVGDTGQLMMNWSSRELRLAPITAMQAATSLVTEWSGFTLGAKYGRPGIWICKGVKPTPAEIAENRKVQEAFFRGLVQDATDSYNKGKSVDISDLHRRAAEWLLGTGAQSLPWMNKMDYRELKVCPACGEEIMAAALSCKNCQTYLPEFYAKAKLDSSADPVVHAAIQRTKTPPSPTQPK